MHQLLTGFCLLLLVVQNVYSQFQVYDQWSSVDFSYDSTRKQDDIRSGKLRTEDVVIYDSQLYLGGGQEILFVTTPDLYSATPFSLNTVSNTKTSSDGSSMLIPYPDESWYRGSCNNSITSVFRIKIDALERLWVLDSGTVNQMTPNISLVCPPQILVFDLKKNNTLIKQYQIPSEEHYDDSLLINFDIDIRNNDGSDTMVYIADVTGYRMLVYNMKTDFTYHIDTPYFDPFPEFCFFRNINGVNFTLQNGLYAIAIGSGRNPKRPVYFHSLSSSKESMVELNILSDPTLSQDAFKYKLSESRGFHSSVEVMSQSGFLIFSNIIENSIMIWDTLKPYRKENFITLAKDDVRFQFITGMQLLTTGQLIITSSRYQNVITNRIAKKEINYRVLINLDISKYITRKTTKG